MFDDGECREPAPGRCDVWSPSWDRFRPRRRPTPGLDERLLSAEARPPLCEKATVADRIGQVVRGDLARTWALGEVADRLGMKPRSLQRALSTEGKRFSAVVEDLRVRAAHRLLTSSKLSVPKIGSVCGLADTSHFSRRFKRRHQVAPSTFRREIPGERA